MRTTQAGGFSPSMRVSKTNSKGNSVLRLCLDDQFN